MRDKSGNNNSFLKTNSITMTALIIDDERNQRDVIRQMIDKYYPSVTIIGEAANIDDAYKLIIAHQPNLLFLDVEMPHGSGFDLLKKFDKLNFEVIFITGFGHYAIQAFEFNALHFILKPIDDIKLIDAVQRAEKRFLLNDRERYNTIFLENLQRSNKDFLESKLAIPVSEGIIYIRVKDIIRCESDGGNTSIYHTDGSRIYSSKNLKEYENMLRDYGFSRVHNSHLINRELIVKMLKQDGGVIVLIDGTQIPISRRRKDDFLKELE